MHPILYPEMALIQKMSPSEGERSILNFLWKTLSSDYEVYYKPFINGNTPDIVIVRRKYGIILIDICDWELNEYAVNESGYWEEGNDKKKSYIWLSPFNKLTNYKSNIVNFYCNKSPEQNIARNKIWGTINRMIYFCNTSQEETNRFCNQKECISSTHEIKYFGIFGRDGLTQKALNDYFKITNFTKPNSAFTDELYHDLQRYLKPPHHDIEEGIDIHYTKEQSSLIVSSPHARRKIKGTAGCGKTLVLAKRAVNAYIRTQRPILILTFNLALKNYIRDRISDVKESFGWENFYITNYHQFIKDQSNKYNLTLDFESFDNIHLFDCVKNRIQPYAAIFIDEIQDYKQEWIDIIVNNFTNQETELVVFGDEKQNIYDNAIVEDTDINPKELIIRRIPGPWYKSLKTTFRLGTEIATLAKAFQIKFLQKKYSIDEMSISQRLNFEGHILEYYRATQSTSVDWIVDMIYNQIKLYDIHPSDIAILGCTREYMREIDYNIRTRYKEKTAITFDTKEEYARNASISKDICRVRKNELILRSGTIKISTIHSFKGWEIHTVILIVENTEHVNPELVYTGLTRAKHNLIIINLGNATYDAFFSSRMHCQEIS